MAKTLEEMRAELNGESALDYFSNLLAPVKAAYTHMPGAPIAQAALASVSDMFGQVVGAPYGIGKQIATGRLDGSPEGTAYAYDQAQQLANKVRYTPPTQAGRDIYEGVNKIPQVVTGSHMGFGPLPEMWNANMRVSPDDVRVAGKTVVDDVRNFPSDYANARAGLTRDYPTAGSTVANVVQRSEPVVENVVKPLAQKGYEMYTNPWDSERSSASPIADISGIFKEPRMYAVKPKGGNWPTNLGSTAPLSEQGALGKHLSTVQYSDPVPVFQNQLEKYYPRGIDNRDLVNKWEDYLYKALKVSMEPNSPDAYLSNADLRKKATDAFVADFNSNLPEGQKPLYTIEQIEQTLPTYNSWVMGPYQKYITNQMGTGLPSDPLLQAVNESGMPSHEIFGQQAPKDWESESIDSRASRTRDSFLDTIYGYGDSPERQNATVGKITATTPEGVAYENALDASLYAKGPYAFKGNKGETDKFPTVAKLDRNALISDFLTAPEERTGLTQIRKQVFQDLMSGSLDPNKLSNVTPATVTRQMIKDKMAEFKEAQLSKKGAADWIPKRVAEMPTDMAFPDGSKMTIITPEMAKADEAMTARDLGQITIDLNQCVGAGCHATQDYPGHGPYIVPHTGKPPRGKVEYDKYGYMRRLKNDEIEVASLKDPSGISQATIELKLQGKSIDSASEVLKRHREIKEWLRENAPDRLEQYMKDFSDDGLTPKLMSKLWDIYGFDEFITSLAGSRKKSIQQIKGMDNGDTQPEYSQQLKQWLNANADTITTVSDLNHVPDVYDLNNHHTSLDKLTSAHPEWSIDSAEQLFHDAEDNKRLPRFFDSVEFEELANKMGVNLTEDPVYGDSNSPIVQKAYESVIQQIIDTFEDQYVQDAFKNGDTNALNAIIQEIEERPRGYGLGEFSPKIRNQVIQKLRNEASANNIAEEVQNFEPEPAPQQFDRPNAFQRDLLSANMESFFDGHEHNLPEALDEPYATQTRILMGNQSEEAKLPVGVHRRLVEALLDQDNHTTDLRDLMNRFQQNNHFLTEAQAENMLNILISWTERYPLAE